MRQTRVLGAGIPTNAYLTFLKMIDLALPQIYTSVFHLWKSIYLDSALVTDSRPHQLSFLWYVLARLERRHNRVLGVGIPTNSYLTF